MNVLTDLVSEQLENLRRVYPGTVWLERPDGTLLVRVPGMRLRLGWSKDVTAIAFTIPVGYPMARPDCFWADGDLRLAGGTMPANSGVQPYPDNGEPALWFSWHLSQWDPARDSLLTYARVVADRLARVA